MSKLVDVCETRTLSLKAKNILDLVVSQHRGPQYKSKNTILMIGSSKRVHLILGNSHFWSAGLAFRRYDLGSAVKNTPVLFPQIPYHCIRSV